MHGLRILMSGLTEKKTTIEQLMNIGSQQCFIISSRCYPVSEKNIMVIPVALIRKRKDMGGLDA